MKVSLPLAMLAAVALVACDSTAPATSLVSDSVVTADVAASAGDAIASSLDAMIGSEVAGSMPGVASAQGAPLMTVSRTTTCYDATGAVVQGCSPHASVRKIVSHLELSGGRNGTRETTGGRTVSWTGAIHRIADDTVTRNFTTAQPPVEDSRTHSSLVVAHDTTTFSDGTNSRTMTEAARDTVKAVTWKLPRSSNPFPVSGSIVRVDSIRVVATNGTRTESRELFRRIEVDFPADAQGNVVLKVNDKTCSLNLVTRKVSNCG